VEAILAARPRLSAFDLAAQTPHGAIAARLSAAAESRERSGLRRKGGG
jgi:hypothetical protein